MMMTTSRSNPVEKPKRVQTNTYISPLHVGAVKRYAEKHDLKTSEVYERAIEVLTKEEDDMVRKWICLREEYDMILEETQQSKQA